MTLTQIIKLALRQLDEDPADVAEHEELFRMYANSGYQIILRNYYKPKATISAQTDEEGRVHLTGMGVARVVSVMDDQNRDVDFALSEDGEKLLTARTETPVTILYEEEMRELEMADEPKIPGYVHPALVDYICYRHLSTGNLAKQAKAEFYRNNFYQQAQQLRAQGSGSVKRMRNLYTATDIRVRG